MGDRNQGGKYPISMRWTIYRKEIENHQFLQTKEFVAKTFGITYFIRLFVAETHQDERGNSAIYFYINPKNSAGGVKADISINLPSLKECYRFEHLYNNAHDWGVPFCRSDFFLQANSPAFNDEKFVIEIKGILSVATEQRIPFAQNQIGSNILDHGEEDFTLVMDGKELKVHKIVLVSCSDVFADTFRAVNMIKEENNRLEIDDFAYETVEAAIMYCYQKDGFINDTNIADVCKFVDKYEIKGFKKNIVQYMDNNISSTNICQYINAAHYLYASEFETKCMGYLRDLITNKTAVIYDHLYPGFSKNFIEYACCNNIRTEFVR